MLAKFFTSGDLTSAMSPGNDPRGYLVEVHRYSGLGCLFAAAVLFSMGIGWLIDRWLGTLPLFMVIGALIGATLATVSIYRRLEHDTEDRSTTEER